MKKSKQFFICTIFVLLTLVLISPSAMSAEPIKIANIEALSGPFEQFGNQSRVGFELGMEYATKGTMKLLGRNVEIIVKDSQSLSHLLFLKIYHSPLLVCMLYLLTHHCTPF